MLEFISWEASQELFLELPERQERDLLEELDEAQLAAVWGGV